MLVFPLCLTLCYWNVKFDTFPESIGPKVLNLDILDGLISVLQAVT